MFITSVQLVKITGTLPEKMPNCADYSVKLLRLLVQLGIPKTDQNGWSYDELRVL